MRNNRISYSFMYIGAHRFYFALILWYNSYETHLLNLIKMVYVQILG
jgi:hypothetical protein